MAIKTNSMTISETGVTLTNAYSKVENFQVNKNPTDGSITVDAHITHYANSSSRAANKQPVSFQHFVISPANEMTGSLASGSFSFIYDKAKLVAPFSGSTITDV